jgi:serine/threonine protein kinase
MLSVGSLLFDRYRIEGILGHGGMGTVYLATHVLLGRPVAIKQLYMQSLGETAPDAVALRQLKHEAQLLQVLKHPRLPAVYDYIELDGFPYLVMEYVSGRTLAATMESGEEHSEARVLRWGISLCDVLQYLHGQKPPIIFRDMKPQNIILDRHGDLKLIDFGIAKQGNPSSQTNTFAKRAGSPGYSAPEQYNRTTDERSDLYSLGATLYALLTRTRPPQSVEIAAGVAALRPLTELRPDLRPQFCELIHRCMRLNAQDRPQTAEEVRQQLEVLHPPDVQAGQFFKVDTRGRPGDAPTHLLSGDPSDSTPQLDFGPSKTERLPTSKRNTLAVKTARKIPVPESTSGKLAGSGSGKLSAPPPAAAPVRTRGWLVPGLIGIAAVGALTYGVLRHGGATSDPDTPASTGPTGTTTVTASTPTTSSQPSASASAEVQFDDQGSAFHFEQARETFLAMQAYELDEEDSHPAEHYHWRAARPDTVRLEVTSGPQRGTVYVRKGNDGVTVSRDGKTSRVSASSLHGLPPLKPPLDAAFAAVQHTTARQDGSEMVGDQDSWKLSFSNGITWNIDKATSVVLRVRQHGHVVNWSHVQSLANPNIGP